MIVVDTNIITYFLVPGSYRTLAQQASQRDVWCAPILWRSEFRNVLALYMRQSGMSRLDAGDLMNVAERLLWGREFSVRSATVLDCLARSNRSAYDCEFVALAQDLGLRLLTSDEPLISAFPETAVRLRDYIQ